MDRLSPSTPTKLGKCVPNRMRISRDRRWIQKYEIRLILSQPCATQPTPPLISFSPPPWPMHMEAPKVYVRPPNKQGRCGPVERFRGTSIPKGSEKIKTQTQITMPDGYHRCENENIPNYTEKGGVAQAKDQTKMYSEGKKKRKEIRTLEDSPQYSQVNRSTMNASSSRWLHHS